MEVYRGLGRALCQMGHCRILSVGRRRLWRGHGHDRARVGGGQGYGFCVNYFLSNEKKWHNRSWAILKNFNFWMIKGTKIYILPSAIWLFLCVSIFFTFKNWSFAKLLVVVFLSQFSGERKIWENERKYWTQKLGHRDHRLLAHVAWPDDQGAGHHAEAARFEGLAHGSFKRTPLEADIWGYLLSITNLNFLSTH